MKSIRILLLALFLFTSPALADERTATSPAPVEFSTKILGGTESKSGDWPWMAALLYADEPDMFYAQYCSGSLIDNTWILTAAHCVDGLRPTDINVAVGVFDLNNFLGSRTEVKSIHIHPGYNRSALTNDIALIELKQASSQPKIRLFSGQSTENAPPPLLGRMLTALGWGLADGSTSWYWPSKLRQVDLPVVANSFCNDIYPNPLPASQLCAGYFEGKDVCNGDSGGAVVTEIDGAWVHVGLVSYGAPCQDYFGWYGVYTRTSEFVNFIRSYALNAHFTGRALPWMGPLLFN